MHYDKMALEADLIPVGRDITARPGDKLIVAAGICIGVMTGKRHATPALAAPEPSPPAVEEEGERPPQRGRKPGHRMHMTRVEMAAKRASLNERIRNLVERHPGITSITLGDFLGIPRDDVVNRSRVRSETNKLMRDGTIRGENISETGPALGRKFYPASDAESEHD